jgi:hypothetical protein
MSSVKNLAQIISNFSLLGTGTSESIIIEYIYTQDGILFTPRASKYPTEISIILKDSYLVFFQWPECKITKTFNLPFYPSEKQVCVHGTSVKILLE